MTPAMASESKVGGKQNKNRSKRSKQQTPSTSKYPEHLLVTLESGTITRITDVLEKFEDRMHMLREAIEREIEPGTARGSAHGGHSRGRARARA
jgi:hypothetical protein